jgi:CMP-N-acetylneuraminic acid synthetase
MNLLMRILGLIPARGGSKGIPKKNIRLLLDKPLLQYTAEAALASQYLSRVILSTDDPEIAQVGKHCGLEVPFLRPNTLAQDNTPTLPVVQHALHFLEQNQEKFDAVCLLQPTCPLRQTSDIDSCLKLFGDQNADTVVTVLPVPDKYNPHWVYFQNDEGLLYLSTGEPTPIPRRQELPTAYHREGSIYITRRDVIMEQGRLYGHRLYGYPLPSERSVNIDTMDDWRKAEELLLRASSNTMKPVNS